MDFICTAFLLQLFQQEFLSVWLIKKYNIKTIQGEPIVIPKKEFHWGYVIGCALFGIGWGFSGACPGPILALIGAGNTGMLVVFLSALLGTWVIVGYDHICRIKPAFRFVWLILFCLNKKLSRGQRY
jgi:uncharacterized membrane protein YedE/YeeE